MKTLVVFMAALALMLGLMIGLSVLWAVSPPLVAVIGWPLLIVAALCCGSLDAWLKGAAR